MMVRQLLELKTRSPEEYRAAFDRLDVDGSGFIEVGEVEQIFRSGYSGEQVPSVEVRPSAAAASGPVASGAGVQVGPRGC